MASIETERPRDALAKLRIPRPPEPPPRRGSLWKGLLLLILLTCGGVACLVGMTRAGWITGELSWLSVPDAIKPKAEVRVATVTVESGRSADALVVATGYLESRRQAKIGARAPGRIELVNVEEGSPVKTGELLAVLEHADLEAALAAARASLARSNAELAEQEVEIARAEREHTRQKQLFGQNIVSDAEYDQAKFLHEAAVARRDSLKAAIALGEARVREAEQMKENMFIRAPFDGTVISKDAEVGESILPGGMGEASGRGSVVTIADLEHLEVDSDVKEDYISRVRVDQPAEVAVDAVPGHRYRGRVRKVIPMGDRARATIKVKVEILDVDQRLFPEMSSTVFFLPSEQEIEPAPAAPRIFCRGAAIQRDDASAYVLVVDQDDRLQRVDVEVLAERDGRAEIATGLSGGERVVLEPPATLRSGQLVKIAD